MNRAQGKFLWPGFGENIRVLDWICQRIDGADIAEPSPVGLVPKPGSLNIDGLGKVSHRVVHRAASSAAFRGSHARTYSNINKLNTEMDSSSIYY